MQINEFEFSEEATLYDDGQSVKKALQEKDEVREEDDDETRIRRLIYERLGLEFGSLANEGGNDWMRAREDVMAELKQLELESIKSEQNAQNLQDTAEILDEFKPENEEKILNLIAGENLASNQIDKLINLGKKDIFIALSRSQNLSSEQILKILPNAPYLAVNLIIKHQDISAVRDKIIAKITANPVIYKELIADLKVSKW